MLITPRVWELISHFKEECRLRGWKTSENEDWIRIDSTYHNFLWARSIHPSTFERVAAACKCAIKLGISYQVVDVAFTAWLFPESPPSSIVQTVARDSDLAERIAIYDFSNVYAGRPYCLKLNETASEVFREFESFLRKRWELELTPALSLLKRES